MLGLIFRKAQNKVQDPAKLRQLIVELIGKEEWLSPTSDVKGGAGQYFTPRPLIDAMVECVQPKPTEIISHPACGTGGFLLAAHTSSPAATSSTGTRRSTFATRRCGASNWSTA